MRDAMVFHNLLQGGHPRECALDTQFDEVVGQQPTASATAERTLANRFVGHIKIVVATGADDVPRDRELPTGRIPHSRGASHIAGVVVGKAPMIVTALVQVEYSPLDQIMGEFTDVLTGKKIDLSGSVHLDGCSAVVAVNK